MSIGIGIFASVILLLVVYHKTFRKVFFWSAGIAAVIGSLVVGGVYLYDRHEAKAAQLDAAFKALGAVPAPDKNPFAAFGIPGSPEPHTQTMLAPDGTIGEVPIERVQDALNSGFKLSSALLKFVPYKPYKVVEIRDGDTLKIVDRQYSDLPAGAISVPQNPIIYLGHNQKFAFICGDFGARGLQPGVMQKDEVVQPTIYKVTCP
jgi:hypothetical protein